MSNQTNPLIERRKTSPAGAGHYHVADLYPYKVRVQIRGRTVAETTQAIVLKEVGKSVYHPSFYVPAEDVDGTAFEKEAGFSTHCPIKGEASYWRYTGDEDGIERAAWSYDAPLEYSAMIAGHLGFDQRYATIEISPVD